MGYGTDTPTSFKDTVPPAIGFKDAKGRFWRVEFTRERMSALLADGIDLAAAMGSEQRLFDLLVSGSRESLLRLGATLYIACGGNPYGDIVTPDGRTIAPEEFSAVIRNHKTIEGTVVALFEALEAYQPSSICGRVLHRSIPKFRSRKGK